MKLKVFLAFAAIALIAAGCNSGLKKVESDSQGYNQPGGQGTTASTPSPARGLKGAADQSNIPGTAHYSDGSDVDVAPMPEVIGVQITANGFSPSTVTVKQGDYVQFTNEDAAPHWPASNPHPTHTDLPGFDAKKALATGESYRFQFTKIGTWGYHDHKNPSVGGTVIVQ